MTEYDRDKEGPEDMEELESAATIYDRLRAPEAVSVFIPTPEGRPHLSKGELSIMGPRRAASEYPGVKLGRILMMEPLTVEGQDGYEVAIEVLPTETGSD